MHSAPRFAHMVKRSTSAVFEELFDIYFSASDEIYQASREAVQNALSMSDQEFKSSWDEVREDAEEQGKTFRTRQAAIAEQSARWNARFARPRAPSSCRESNARSRRTTSHARSLVRSPRQDRSRDSRRLREQLEKMDIGSELKAKMEEYLERRLKALETSSAVSPDGAREARHQEKEDQRLNQIGEKALLLTEEELKKMTRRSPPRAAAQERDHRAPQAREEGRFDIKRTCAESRIRGVPFKLRFEKRKKEKPQVVILATYRTQSATRRGSCCIRLFVAGSLFARAQLHLRRRYR